MRYCTVHRTFCPKSKYSLQSVTPNTLSPLSPWLAADYLQPHSDSFGSFPETIGSRIGLYLTLWRQGEEGRNTRTSKYQSSRMTK
jgi:hypothetical protein